MVNVVYYINIYIIFYYIACFVPCVVCCYSMVCTTSATSKQARQGVCLVVIHRLLMVLWITLVLVGWVVDNLWMVGKENTRSRTLYPHKNICFILVFLCKKAYKIYAKVHIEYQSLELDTRPNKRGNIHYPLIFIHKVGVVSKNGKIFQREKRVG